MLKHIVKKVEFNLNFLVKPVSKDIAKYSKEEEKNVI